MSIITKNITKIYGQQKALDNVSFEIGTGTIVGFIGPNGAGKSTMMKIITGFIPQTSGDVFVNGYNVLENPIEVRKDIGYLPETNPLYPDMYVREYLQYVAGLYRLGKKSSQRIDEMIEQTGLTAEIKKKIGTLSKGYRQRVGLAQALIHNPKILVLDEPTSGLDPNQIIEIRNLISQVGKEKTVILSTHIMQEVEAICQKVMIINNGQIIADDFTGEMHKHSSSDHQTIVVEFDSIVNRDLLLNVKGVSKVVGTKNNCWLIQSTDDIDVRPEIFKFAVKNNLTVLSLEKKKKSLEDVFQELTKSM